MEKIFWGMLIKKSFERLQKVTVLVLCTVFIWSCQSRNEEPLSDELISFNLSESGKIDPELLVGEWDCVQFAYTADGKKISSVSALKTKHNLLIPIFSTPIENDMEDRWRLSGSNTFWYICYLLDNSIDIKLVNCTQMYTIPPHEEYDITLALANTRSFVIKGDELMIYFTKIEDKEKLSYCTVINNKNLLILKKQ